MKYPWNVEPELTRMIWAAHDRGIDAHPDRPEKPGAAFSILFLPQTDHDPLWPLPQIIRKIRGYTTEWSTLPVRDQKKDANRSSVLLNFFPAHPGAAPEADTLGGALDSVSQLFMYDKQLLEARRARQQARVAAQTAQERRKAARAKRRATQEETRAAQSEASQERRSAREAARAEAQRVRQARSVTQREAARLEQMRVATQQEMAQAQTARAGARRDTAETRRSVAQVANTEQLTEAQADPSRIVTRAGAPVQAAVALRASAPTAQLGAEGASSTRAWGFALSVVVAGALVGSFYFDQERPLSVRPWRPEPVRRLPIP